MKERFSFSKTTLKGLVVLLPVLVLTFTVFWLIFSVEYWLASFYRMVFSDKLYVPGFGLLTAIVLSFLVGLLMNSAAAQRLYDTWEHQLQRIPLIKSLYGAVQDIVKIFSRDQRERYNRVVIVHFKEANVRLVGFVTQENADALPLGIEGQSLVSVYLPMSYQIGGYFILVPKSMVEPVNLSLEDASRLVLTAGMSTKKNDA